MKQIMKLNPLAQKLRWERKFYEFKMIYSILKPYQIPLVLRKINQIKKKQKELSLKQQDIWNKGLRIFSKEIKKVNLKFEKMGGKKIQYENDFPMALEKKPIKSESSSYVPMKNFFKKTKFKN